MTTRRSRSLLTALALVFGASATTGFAPPSMAQSAAAPIAAKLTIDAGKPGAVIDRNLYGQFAEHLGRSIYEGIWVGEDAAIPNTRGFRNDVVAALKNLSVPVVRWPGGCFADEYHWREGIGPRDKRPVRVNTNWGGVEETNAFGTHEFMEFVELIGAEAYINGNVGTGSPQEMAEWLEYMTSDTRSSLANLRRANGRDKPWKVKFWAVGNETWGCGGSMRPEYYADIYRQYAEFLKAPKENRPLKIASGANGDDVKWTEVLMAQAAKKMDALSVHYYTLPTGVWKVKGSATKFGEQEWIDTLAQTLRMDDIVTRHSAAMDRHDPEKRVGLYVDEWGTWYDVEPGTNPGFLYQQNSVRDALVTAVNFNIFHKHADRVRMSNIAQMVNVLQAMILTDKEKMLLTPTYHVFEMYKPFQNATSLPITLSAPEYRFGAKAVPSVSASAARDAAGKIYIALANLDASRPAELNISIGGTTAAKGVTGRVLTGPAINSINTFEKPDTVKPASFSGAKLKDGQVNVTLPGKSVVVLEVR